MKSVSHKRPEPNLRHIFSFRSCTVKAQIDRLRLMIESLGIWVFALATLIVLVAFGIAGLMLFGTRRTLRNHGKSSLKQ